MALLSSIRIKVWICVGVAFVGFFMTALSTWQSNSRLSTKMTAVGDLYFPLAQNSERALFAFHKQAELYGNAFLLGDEEALNQANEMSQEISGLLDEMTIISQDTPLTSHIQLGALKTKYEKYAQRAARDYKLSASIEESLKLQERIKELGLTRSELLSSFQDNSKTFALSVEQEIAHSKRIARKNTSFVLTIFLVVLLLATFIINVVANTLLIKPLQMIQQMVGRLAKGDLNLGQRIAAYTKDEIGELAQAIQDMAGKLRSMVFRIDDTSKELVRVSYKITETSAHVDETAHLQAKNVDVASSAARRIDDSVVEVGHGVDTLSNAAGETTASILEMATNVEGVAQNADELAESVEDVSSSITQMATSIKQVDSHAKSLKKASDVTTSSVDQMDSSIKQVEQSAKETVEIAGQVRTDIQEGKTSVEATIAGIREIREASTLTSDVVKSLSHKTEEIDSILLVIDELAERTNLLALNAAIIAGEAGEHGRGFAVVADQIKSLANRTTNSTKEISLVIQGVKEETRKAVLTIDQAEKRIGEGTDLSKRSGRALNQVVAGIEKTVEQMDHIADLTSKQAQGSTMIKQAMEKVSTMVNEIAGATFEQEQGSHRILNASETMRNLTSQVKNSTRTQSNGSKVIARSTQRISDMIHQIKEACDALLLGSKQIVEAVTGIQKSTGVNLGATKVLNDAVVKLSEQTQNLQKEMSNFKITDN